MKSTAHSSKIWIYSDFDAILYQTSSYAFQLKTDAKMNKFRNGGTRLPPLPPAPLKLKNPN